MRCVWRTEAVSIALLRLAVGLRAYQFALGGASPARALTEPGACPESHLPIHTGAKTVVRTAYGNSNGFEVKVAMHQCSALSRLLFVIGTSSPRLYQTKSREP